MRERKKKTDKKEERNIVNIDNLLLEWVDGQEPDLQINRAVVAPHRSIKHRKHENLDGVSLTTLICLFIKERRNRNGKRNGKKKKEPQEEKGRKIREKNKKNE